MMGDLAKELDFRFIRCGKVLVGNTDEDMETLKRTIRQGDVYKRQGTGRTHGFHGMETGKGAD